MAAIEVGRVCVKIAGRSCGAKVVITKIIDKNFVQIIEKGAKKPVRCAVRHLEPTLKVVSEKEIDAEIGGKK